MTDRTCETCRHMSGIWCKRREPMQNTRTGEAFWPTAQNQRSNVDYHRGNVTYRCGPAGIYWESRTQEERDQ